MQPPALWAPDLFPEGKAMGMALTTQPV